MVDFILHPICDILLLVCHLSHIFKNLICCHLYDADKWHQLESRPELREVPLLPQLAQLEPLEAELLNP